MQHFLNTVFKSTCIHTSTLIYSNTHFHTNKTESLPAVLDFPPHLGAALSQACSTIPFHIEGTDGTEESSRKKKKGGMLLQAVRRLTSKK